MPVKKTGFCIIYIGSDLGASRLCLFCCLAPSSPCPGLTLGLLALLCALTLPAQAATNFVVTSTADTDGTTCAAGTPCTLREGH